MVQVKNKVCLIVHDGWGIAPEPDMEGDAINAGVTTNMDTISKDHSVRQIAAHGLAVGLNDGLMGNSEVGHLNIGAGRIVWQDVVRIDQSIKKRQFHKTENILNAMKRAKEGNGRLHLLGLVSDGGVHSHINHLFALLETAKEQGVPKAFIHFIGDGRDTAPKSGAGYAKQLQDFIEKEKYGTIATVTGRYYAMDRDKRWERIKIAVDGLVKGEGEKAKDPVAAIEARYEQGETDEFLKPIIMSDTEEYDVKKDEGRIKDEDTLFFFNYRSDRMREIAEVLGVEESEEKREHIKNLSEMTIPKNLGITTMSTYKTDFTFPVAFAPQAMTDVLAETLSKQGVKQMHVAETEKYAHVTFFFNGGVERQFENEERELLPSPQSVATYDKAPEMNVEGVANAVAKFVETGKYEFVICNFAPPDMVGHTGNYEAAVKAITATDKAVGIVYKACQEAGYILLVTADHGNAEQMINPETKQPHTAHTTNKVPFIMTGDNSKIGFVEDKEGEDEEPGALCDVAPTILDLMGLQKPADMTGRSLLLRKDEQPSGEPESSK